MGWSGGWARCLQLCVGHRAHGACESRSPADGFRPAPPRGEPPLAPHFPAFRPHKHHCPAANLPSCMRARPRTLDCWLWTAAAGPLQTSSPRRQPFWARPPAVRGPTPSQAGCAALALRHNTSPQPSPLSSSRPPRKRRRRKRRPPRAQPPQAQPRRQRFCRSLHAGAPPAGPGEGRRRARAGRPREATRRRASQRQSNMGTSRRRGARGMATPHSRGRGKAAANVAAAHQIAKARRSTAARQRSAAQMRMRG